VQIGNARLSEGRGEGGVVVHGRSSVLGLVRATVRVGGNRMATCGNRAATSAGGGVAWGLAGARVRSVAGMRFGVLGVVQLYGEGGRPVPVGGPRQVSLLAFLLVHAGTAVSNDELVEAVWGDREPAGALKRLQVAVARLRKTLNDTTGDRQLLRSVGSGYLLTVDETDVDAGVFVAGMEAGRQALDAGDPGGAAGVLRDALSLWRGPALADVAYEDFAQAEIRRLEELRITAFELRVEADLALGRHGELVAELEGVVVEHPTRERLAGQLMLALYRCSRQADALEIYQRTRMHLAAELGLEPGPALQELQSAVLDHSAPLASAADHGAPRPTAGVIERRDRLPMVPNPTIGRDREIADVAAKLARDGHARLLSLVGPGGVGKTRLAIEVARGLVGEFAAGARFVALAAVRRAEDVPAAIIQSLGIVPIAGESPEQSVERYLAPKELLLVLDNLEHVLTAAGFVSELLASCPALIVLATSREALALAGEQRYPVAPLAVAVDEGNAESLARVPAVALFCERAQAHDPDFRLSDVNANAVADICRRVDGLPLAIELAAARCGVLSPAEIDERLDTALGALGTGARDAPTRQRTLRATIDWSHDLLSEAEKHCFARFAVFAGGASVEAAEAITDACLDTLDGLIAKNLLVVRRDAHARSRLGMLETVRAYAAERFAAAHGEDAVHERHYNYFLALAQHHGSEQALMRAGRLEHLTRLDAEIDNLHSALRWAVDQTDAERALALCVALGWYWYMRDRWADAVEWIDQALRLAGSDDHPSLRVQALGFKAFALWPLGREREQPATNLEATTIARELGEPLLLSRALRFYAGSVSVGDARHDVIDPLADEALSSATAAADDWQIALAWEAKAKGASTAVELRDRVQRAVSLLERVGNIYYLGILLIDAEWVALNNGDDRDAMDFADRARPVIRELDSPFLWMHQQGNLGLAALFMGDTETARDAFGEELKLCRELVFQPAEEGLHGLAALAALHGDDDRAARLAGAAVAHSHGHAQEPVEKRLYARFLAPARARHGAKRWDTAVREGSALGFEDAIAFALQERGA
jgi:predicted ATPase/DNA-binding SARP family transcriptional activator